MSSAGTEPVRDDHGIRFRNSVFTFEIRDSPYLSLMRGTGDVALRTIDALAEIAGVPSDVIRGWVAAGRLEGVEVGGVVFVAGNGESRQYVLMAPGTFPVPPVLGDGAPGQ